MIFYLHYILLASGLSGTSVLLPVYFKTYSDASQSEIGVLMMVTPFLVLFVRPVFCSMADRRQAHHAGLVLSLLTSMIGFSPFLIVPFSPTLHETHPRLSWYSLAFACLLGASGLNVAWSLGDTLAVNYAQRTGVPFGRMRMMGTISWGVYGFIIGQINEHPSLPKYVPVFIILHLSFAIELLLLAVWERVTFEMFDPLASQTPVLGATTTAEEQSQQVNRENQRQRDLTEPLPSISGQQYAANSDAPKSERFDEVADGTKMKQHQGGHEQMVGDEQLESGMTAVGAPKKNPQLTLLKMILVEDGRVLKYIIVFTAFGMFFVPINFFFVSMESLCHERGYNFSQLAGAVLMSQAFAETVAFLVVPSLLNSITRWSLLSASLAAMSTKYIFYAGWYYDAGVSPYWAVLAECSYGLAYGILCIIVADVSLMFANQSRLFIPELRRLGFLRADTSHSSKEAIEAEERSIKMALRATMQALFSGFMDGLLCGLIIDLYSFHALWLTISTLIMVVLALHVLVEVTGSRWSDAYKPTEGTKAYEIMELDRATAEAQRRRLAEAKAAKSAPVG
jgi:hypothetical protein